MTGIAGWVEPLRPMTTADVMAAAGPALAASDRMRERRVQAARLRAVGDWQRRTVDQQRRPMSTAVHTRPRRSARVEVRQRAGEQEHTHEGLPWHRHVDGRCPYYGRPWP